MELKLLAEKALSKAASSNSDNTQVTISSTEAKEFNIEANKLTLLRTTFDQNINIKTQLGKKLASCTGNQFSEDALSTVVSGAINATKASQEDEHNGFAPNQGIHNFSHGTEEINEDWMYEQLAGFLDFCKQKYPKIILESTTVKFYKTKKILATSSGTFLSSSQNYYDGVAMFTAKENNKSSSFNYTEFSLPSNTPKTKIPLYKISDLENLLQQSSEQLSTQKVPEKFEGDVIITPHCMSEIASAWLEFIGPGRMLRESNYFKDKLGEKVASPLLTLQSIPIESAFATRKFWTADGYLSENEPIFKNGVLKNYLLNHYAASKLKQRVSKSEGSYLKIQAGNQQLKELIASVKKGVLMCRYSAGMPADNGDISGVAKNSYYIENGEIKFPLTETMLSTNLFSMLRNIEAVSKETVTNGHWEFPWVKFNGVAVS